MSATNDQPANVGDKAALLNRGLGVSGIVFMVAAAVAPLGAVCVVIPLVFALSGNPSSPLYFVGAGAVLCLFAVGFTLMSRHVPNAGAFYAYVQAGLGKVPGAGTASLALVSYTVLHIALYGYLGVVAAAAVDSYLGLTVNWWVLSFAFLAVIAFLGYRDIEVSAKVLGVVLVLEVCVVLVIDAAIVFQGGASGLSLAPLDPSHVLEGAPGLGLVFAFSAFLGFESTAVFRSEAKDPERTIPRATYIAVVLIALLYAFTSWAVAIGFGPEQVVAVTGAGPEVAVPNLAAQYVGSAMQDIVELLLVTSIGASALSFHNVVARYQFNLANGGLLPAPLGEVHLKHLAPSRSSITVTAVTAVVLGALTIGGLDPVTEIYTWLAAAGTLGIIGLMAMTSVAVIVFHQRLNAGDPLWNTTIAPVLSLVGLGLALYLVVDNFALLVAGRTAANIICLAVVCCFAAGAGFAAVARARRPEFYAAMLND